MNEMMAEELSEAAASAAEKVEAVKRASRSGSIVTMIDYKDHVFDSAQALSFISSS